MLQNLQQTEHQRKVFAADAAAAATNHQQLQQGLQQLLKRQNELILELQEKQKEQQNMLAQHLQQLQREVIMGEEASKASVLFGLKFRLPRQWWRGGG